VSAVNRPRPLRLLLIINVVTDAGGAEVQLLHLARGLAAHGHQVTVCAIDRATVDRDALAAEGIRLVELHAENRWQRVPATWQLIKLARQADVVQCTMWDPSLWGRLAAMVARKPVIVADHSADRSIQVSRKGSSRAGLIGLHNRLLDPITYATVACASPQPAILRAEGVSPEKIVYIPNGVPLDAIRTASEAAPDRAALGLPTTGRLAMQVGLFRAEKNQIGGLEAFVKIRERVPDAELVFVGFGPEQESVERRAAELGADWAHFLGKRGDVPALLRHAAVMLLPSVADAMPMVLLEAMTIGVPILATDVGDVRATLADTGTIVPPRDEGAFVEAAVTLLEGDPAAAARAEAGKARVEQFGAELMVTRYEKLFEGAFDGRPPGGVAADF
jgi:glycosyltransferase involved in cell wall biosynthesis